MRRAKVPFMRKMSWNAGADEVTITKITNGYIVSLWDDGSIELGFTRYGPSHYCFHTLDEAVLRIEEHFNTVESANEEEYYTIKASDPDEEDL